MTGNEIAGGAALSDARRVVHWLCWTILVLAVVIFFAAHQARERNDVLQQCVTALRRGNEVNEFCTEALTRCTKRLKTYGEPGWRSDL